MNRVVRNSVAVLAALATAVCCLGAAEDATAAGSTLREKGLKPSGAYFALPQEAEVAKALDVVRRLQKDLFAAMGRLRAFESDAENNRQLIVEYTQQRRTLRLELDQSQNVQQHNRIVEAMNELGDRVTLLQKEGDHASEIKQAGVEAARKRDAYVQAILELRKAVNEVNERYEALAADASVTKAIEAVNAKSKSKLAMGPTRSYSNNIKAIEKLEAAVLSEVIPLRKENGVFWVDVALNGKAGNPMVFDTGAGLVSLPAEMADQAGLNPTDADPTVNLKTADGRTVRGKLMSLKTVRVGKFTIEDVQCVVLPADLKGAPPLLGGSFLKSFSYKISPEEGKLTLSKVAAPTTAAPAAPVRRPGRAAKKKQDAAPTPRLKGSD